MTKKEREIILKELYMRLPYGIKVLDETWNYEWDQELSLLERVTWIDKDFIYVNVIDERTGEEYRADKHCIDLLSIKPFLRPMSSMTEEEKKKLKADTCPEGTGYFDEKYLICPVNHYGEHISYDFMFNILEWLNANHFDYRGLIEKGLALEAFEGMYTPHGENGNEFKNEFPLGILSEEETEQCRELAKSGYTGVVKYLKNVHPEMGLKECKIYYDLYFNNETKR